mmetsp:Transcript_17271/g.60338  ORF Transcript_17271/g.60338 Transcript_17271/m.60338 type:complete len:339 (-) Transcript_17271:330-1346(-)
MCNFSGTAPCSAAVASMAPRTSRKPESPRLATPTAPPESSASTAVVAPKVVAPRSAAVRAATTRRTAVSPPVEEDEPVRADSEISMISAAYAAAFTPWSLNQCMEPTPSATPRLLRPKKYASSQRPADFGMLRAPAQNINLWQPVMWSVKSEPSHHMTRSKLSSLASLSPNESPRRASALSTKFVRQSWTECETSCWAGSTLLSSECSHSTDPSALKITNFHEMHSLPGANRTAPYHRGKQSASVVSRRAPSGFQAPRASSEPTTQSESPGSVERQSASHTIMLLEQGLSASDFGKTLCVSVDSPKCDSTQTSPETLIDRFGPGSQQTAPSGRTTASL